MTTSTSPRVSLWSRLLWSLQLVVFVGAGLFVAPIARPLQNATRPVASTPHHGERIATRSPSRERTAERIGRLGADRRGDAGHEPILFAAPTLPVIAPADFVVTARWSVASIEARRLRFALHAPRGPPQLA